MSMRPPWLQPSDPLYSAYRYGMLVFILLLLASNIHWRFPLPYVRQESYGSYSGVILSLALLFNHLAFTFRRPPFIAAALPIWALAWSIFALLHSVYWSYILHALPSSP